MRKYLLIRSLYSLLWMGTILSGLQFYYHVNEDAWISFKYARNLADGYGLVSNPGDATQEGYSNLVLVLLLALFKWLFNADPVHTSKIIGILSLTAIVILTYFMVRLLLTTPEHSLYVNQYPFAHVFSQQRDFYLPALSLIIATCIVASKYMSFWTSQGLETTLYALLIWVITYLTLLVILTHQYRWFWLIALISFVSLNTRPEGLMNFPTAIGVIVIGAWLDKVELKEFIPNLIKSSLLFLLFVIILLSFKWYYFGHLLANPSYVKLAVSAWLNPLPYFTGYLNAKGILFNLLLIFAFISSLLTIWTVLRKNASYHLINILLVCSAFTSSQLFFIYYSGGDYMSHSRFLITHYPVFILSIVWFTTVGFALFFKILQKTSLIIVGVILAISAWQEPVTDPNWYEVNFASPLKIHEIAQSGHYIQANRLNQKMDSVTGYYATSEFGYIPYHVKAKGLDILGLNQKEIAYNFKLYSPEDAAYANRDFILAKNPRVILAGRYYQRPDGMFFIHPSLAWFWQPYLESAFFMQNYTTQIPRYAPAGTEDYSYPEEWISSDWNGHFRATHRIDATDTAQDDKLLYGFYREATQIWVAPLARVLLTRRDSDKFLILDGYIPDITKYAEKQNLIKICLNDKGVGDKVVFSQLIQKNGFFTLKMQLDDELFPQDQATLITLRGERFVSSDKRKLAYILKAIYFSEN